MKATHHFTRLVGTVTVVAASIAAASCGDVVRQGKSPVFLVIDKLEAKAGGKQAGTPSGTLQSDVLTLVTTPAPCTPATPCPTIFNDVGTVALRIVPKDIGTGANPTEPSTNNEVTITRYHIQFKRSDGRNIQGLDVPYAFDSAVTGTIPSGGTLSLGFELVRHIAKEESPLVQLANSATIITTIADITFYGKDRVGNEVQVTGSIGVDFGNFGDQ